MECWLERDPRFPSPMPLRECDLRGIPVSALFALSRQTSASRVSPITDTDGFQIVGRRHYTQYSVVVLILLILLILRYSF